MNKPSDSTQVRFAGCGSRMQVDDSRKVRSRAGDKVGAVADWVSKLYQLEESCQSGKGKRGAPAAGERLQEEEIERVVAK